MIPTNNEKFDFSLTKRVENSPYEYEPNVSATFKGRPASQVEKKIYRVLKGVNGNTDSTYIYASNLPQIVDVGDRIEFLGKIWTVQSIGYYFDASLFVNPSLMSEKQIIARCPKGINIQ